MEIKRYDIVQANLSGTIGSEQGGIRPVLVIQNDIGNLHSPTTIVMPFSTKTHKNPSQPTHTLIRKSADTGLKEDSLLLGEQMRVISNQRIIKKIGTVIDDSERKEIRRVYNANFGE
ncbi:MAG: type II toxin-antitoxin system PemK/MazF family toxin [Lachnospiraceae bacterium]|nr:type II toxin-antitoxin system PemK/MazF family toxin [Lachnospiraceae bacterium]